ncbi:MAG: hypothetical protein M1823_008455, partial [Watsoniomyces obsoletus]
IAAKGSPAQILESGALGDDILHSRPVSAAPSRVQSTLERDIKRFADRLQVNGDIEAPDGTIGNPQSAKPDKAYVDPMTEAKATGSIKSATIKMYLKAMGPWWYWIIAASAFIAVQLGSVATNVWIRQWANAYHISSSDSYAHAF